MNKEFIWILLNSENVNLRLVLSLFMNESLIRMQNIKMPRKKR